MLKCTKGRQFCRCCLLAGLVAWVYLSAGDPLLYQMWRYFQIEVSEGEARRKIGELSEKHVAGQFNQG